VSFVSSEYESKQGSLYFLAGKKKVTQAGGSGKGEGGKEVRRGKRGKVEKEAPDDTGRIYYAEETDGRVADEVLGQGGKRRGDSNEGRKRKKSR